MLRRVPFEALVHFFLKSLENNLKTNSILHETTEILQNWYGSWLALLPLSIQGYESEVIETFIKFLYVPTVDKKVYCCITFETVDSLHYSPDIEEKRRDLSEDR